MMMVNSLVVRHSAVAASQCTELWRWRCPLPELGTPSWRARLLIVRRVCSPHTTFYSFKPWQMFGKCIFTVFAIGENEEAFHDVYFCPAIVRND